MKLYQTKTKKLGGTDFHEVRNQAFLLYKKIKKKTKRRPYVRSAYFNKEKVFIDFYWQHLFDQGNWRDRMRRLHFFPCAIELIQKSRFKPQSIKNPKKQSETLYRFVGATKDSELFYVQIKENQHNGQKFLISTFPEK